MFIQHKQLKNLNIPAEKVARIQYASSSVQLAFAGYPPQLCRAYLVQIEGGDKVLVVVAFYLEESDSSIFFVPRYGELPVADAGPVYEEGAAFIESMGFVLTETDYHLMSLPDRQAYWKNMVICRSPKGVAGGSSAVEDDDTLKAYRQLSLESLGRLFASL